MPMAAERSFYVTTPIYYVNAAPHLGHAYTTIAADVMARHHRQRGEDVFFLTGTDEHGEPVADAAKAQGLEPQELADRNAERFKALAPRLEATNDFFIRTSDPRAHQARCRRSCSASTTTATSTRGSTRAGTARAAPTSRSRTRSTRATAARSTTSSSSASRRRTTSSRLTAFQERLEALYAEQPDFVMPRVRYNEALSFIKSGLQDVSLTRAAADLGRPGAVGPEPRLLRLVRRAAELLHRASATRARARTSPSGSGRRPTTSSARTSCASTRSSGRRC